MSTSDLPSDRPSPIAIVGMACRFPQAPNLRSYWRNLRDGVDAVGPVPETHWSVEDYFDQDPQRADHTYAKRGAFLEESAFYPLEFGISPRDLEATDTTQLFAMLAAREAMWDAGYAGPKAKTFDRRKTSVMMGVTGSLELVIPLGARLSHPQWRRALLESGVEESVAQEVIERMSQGYVPWQENSFPGLLGNVAAGRIANRLDLHGTNCVVDAACASSLSALHLACMELQSGRADMAVSGGVDTFNDIFMYMCFSKTPALSKSGDARPFSASADGTILGEGVGVVVLKRLEDAQRDGDHIYAVIAGVGTSSDGKGNAVYAPSQAGQERCLADAYARSGISPREVELVEAHGTGTPVGDGIELSALISTYSSADAKAQEPWCALGSVKSMIGHTKAAAGVAGLIKCALALDSKVLPPTLKIEGSHKLLETTGPLFLNTRARPWLRANADAPRRAAVSAFGFGGSNFHCVLQEAPQSEACRPFGVDTSWQLLALSARSEKELHERIDALNAVSDRDSLRSALAQERVAFDAAMPLRLSGALDLERWSNEAEAMIAELHRAVEQPDGAGPWEFRTDQGVSTPPKVAVELGELSSDIPGFSYLWSARAVEVAQAFLSSPSARRRWWDSQKCMEHECWMNAAVYAELLLALEIEFQELSLEKRANASRSAFARRLRKECSLSEMVSALQRSKAGAKRSSRKGAKQSLRIELSAGGLHLIGRERAVASTMRQEQGALVALAAVLLAEGVNLRREGWDLQAEQGRLAPEGRGMRVAIVGANAKPRPAEPALPPRPRNSVRRATSDAAPRLPQAEPTMTKPSHPATPSFSVPGPITSAQDAFAATQAQIEALLQLQEQSAQLHQQFLESQEATLLRYQELIARQQRLVAAQLGIDGPSPMMTVPHAGATAAPNASHPPAKSGAFVGGALPNPSGAAALRAAPAISAAAAAFAGIATDPEAHPDAAVLPQDPQGAAGQPSDGAEVKPQAPATPAGSTNTSALPESSPSDLALSAALHEVVSDKTGYPKDILESSMELDGDLGIDSIKRVEIASSLSERFEDLASLDAQDLHELATLGDWEQLLLKELGSVQEVRPAPQADSQPLEQDVSAAASELVPAALRRAILEVVSDKTGYPSASLEWEMRLDDDLGIDSIKRVEILAALQEKVQLGELPDAEELAQIESLELLYEALQESSAPESGSELSRDAQHAGSQADQEGIMALLVQVVADKTGYPPEMIEPQMELDQELGIDSIKRVEIMSALAEQLPSAAELEADEVAQMRDLASLAAALQTDHKGKGSAQGEKAVEAPREELPEVVESQPQDSRARPPQRYLTSAEPWEANTASKEPALSELVPAGATLWLLVAPKEPVGMALEQALTDLGYHVAIVSTAKQAQALALPAGLVMVAPPWHVDTAYLREVMGVLKAFGRARRQESVQGGVLMSVTQMNGRFGFGEFPVDGDPLLAGVVGMVKTAAREWPTLRSIACDLESGWTDADEIAVSLLEQLDRGGPVERGLARDGQVYCLRLKQSELRPDELAEDARVPGVEFSGQDLALISAGARGVTAQVARALAEQGLTRFVLVGRSKATLEEPEWIQGVYGEARMKSLIASHASQKMHPRRLQARYQELIAGRAIRAQLEALNALGAQARYVSADLRDAAALSDALAKAQVDPAEVSVLVHGAGVLADGRIEDKTDEDFDRVYGTKVEGVANLLAWCDASPLRVLALFSSSTARFGRVGQVDYAAANEVLNKIAARQAQLRPHCRVASFNWGPWDGGMVNDALKRQFESEGIAVLDRQLAASHVARELAAPQAQVESVIVGETSQIESLFESAGQKAEPRARLLVEAPAQQAQAKVEQGKKAAQDDKKEADATPKAAVASQHEQGQSFLQSLAAQHPSAKKNKIQRSAATSSQRNRATLSAAGKVVWKRSVSLKTDPYLSEHAFASRAVVPAAWMVEWMAQAATRLESSLHLVGVDDFQVLRGVRLTQDEVCDLRVVVGRVDNRGDQRILQMHIASGPDLPGQSTLHGRARVVLSDHPQAKLDSLERFPTLRSDDLWNLHSQAVYDLGLFHEGSFRLIEEIRGNGQQPDLVLGSLRNDLPEDRWQGLGKVSDWLVHPEIMDAAFQMMIVWSLKTQGEASLPTSFGRYRQLSTFDPAAVKLAVHVRRRAPRRATADIVWRDVKGKIVATMRDFSCVMDPALREAFERRSIDPTPEGLGTPVPKVVSP